MKAAEGAVATATAVEEAAAQMLRKRTECALHVLRLELHRWPRRCVHKHVLAMEGDAVVAATAEEEAAATQANTEAALAAMAAEEGAAKKTDVEAALATPVAVEAAVMTRGEKASLAARAAEEAAARKTVETAALAALAHRVLVGALDLADKDKELHARLGASTDRAAAREERGCIEGRSRGGVSGVPLKRRAEKVGAAKVAEEA